MICDKLLSYSGQHCSLNRKIRDDHIWKATKLQGIERFSSIQFYIEVK